MVFFRNKLLKMNIGKVRKRDRPGRPACAYKADSQVRCGECQKKMRYDTLNKHFQNVHKGKDKYVLESSNKKQKTLAYFNIRTDEDNDEKEVGEDNDAFETGQDEVVIENPSDVLSNGILEKNGIAKDDSVETRANQVESTESCSISVKAKIIPTEKIESCTSNNSDEDDHQDDTLDA